MEVLNRNQRRSALWRVGALMGLFLAVVSVVLWAMGTSMGGGNDNEVEALRDSLNNVRDQYDGRILGLENQILDLKKSLAEASGDGSEQELIEELKKINKGLESEIEAYKVDIKVMQFKLSSSP